MRSTRRDTYTVLVQNVSSTTATDKFGNPMPTYTNVFDIQATLSVGSGDANATAYGWNVDHDRQMTVHTDYGINEYSKVFINENGSSREYRVVAIGITKNVYRYALRLVEDVN